MLETSE